MCYLVRIFTTIVIFLLGGKQNTLVTWELQESSYLAIIMGLTKKTSEVIQKLK